MDGGWTANTKVTRNDFCDVLGGNLCFPEKAQKENLQGLSKPVRLAFSFHFKNIKVYATFHKGSFPTQY